MFILTFVPERVLQFVFELDGREYKVILHQTVYDLLEEYESTLAPRHFAFKVVVDAKVLGASLSTLNALGIYIHQKQQKVRQQYQEQEDGPQKFFKVTFRNENGRHTTEIVEDVPSQIADGIISAITGKPPMAAADLEALRISINEI